MGFWSSLAVSVVASAATSTIAGNRNQRISRAAELKGYRQDLINATGNFSLVSSNNLLRSQLAGLNIEAILEVGAINKANIEKARDRNIDMMRIEQAETLRRRINDEVDLGGEIRLGYATSGISTTSGSALAVKLTEMNEAKNDRLYQDKITNLQVLGYFKTETEKAYLVGRESELRASSEEANTELQNRVLENEARQAIANAQQNLGQSGGSSSGGVSPYPKRLRDR